MLFDELSSTLLMALDSVLPTKSCAYVAGPLESGKSYYDAVAAGRPDASISIRPLNELQLRSFADRLRGVLSYPVFDPGLLRVCTWTGAEHGKFFILVLARYAKEAWFLEGWEYSRGASKEFVHCVNIGIPCFDELGKIITPVAGRSRIQRAAEYIEGLGLDASRLRSRLDQLPT